MRVQTREKLELPSGYWRNPKIQRVFFDRIAKELNIDVASPTGWHGITTEDIANRGGSSLLSLYNGSLSKALQSVYPNYQIPEKRRKNKGHWKDITHQKELLENVAQELGFSDLDGWYNIKAKEVMKPNRLGSLLNHYYGGSLIRALETIYPEKDWHPWLFGNTSRHFWQDEENVFKFMEWASKKLNIRKLDDWYFVSNEEISTLGGKHMLATIGNLHSILCKWKPDHLWSSNKFSSLHGSQFSKSQWLLYQRVLELTEKLKEIGIDIKGEEIIMNYKHPELVYSNSQQRMELDIFVAPLSLAFEYQGNLRTIAIGMKTQLLSLGEHHYQSHHLFGTAHIQQLRDEEKRLACTNCGITLIEVPFWWDRSLESLMATVYQKKPGLFSSDIIVDKSASIPCSPPP